MNSHFVKDCLLTHHSISIFISTFVYHLKLKLLTSFISLQSKWSIQSRIILASLSINDKTKTSSPTLLLRSSSDLLTTLSATHISPCLFPTTDHETQIHLSQTLHNNSRKQPYKKKYLKPLKKSHFSPPLYLLGHLGFRGHFCLLSPHTRCAIPRTHPPGAHRNRTLSGNNRERW